MTSHSWYFSCFCFISFRRPSRSHRSPESRGVARCFDFFDFWMVSQRINQQTRVFLTEKSKAKKRLIGLHATCHARRTRKFSTPPDHTGFHIKRHAKNHEKSRSCDIKHLRLLKQRLSKALLRCSRGKMVLTGRCSSLIRIQIACL